MLDAKLRCSWRVPYVLMELPLAANSGGPGGLVHASRPEAGTTLTSAPVSTRNCRCEVESYRKSRPFFWPAATAASGWPWSFPSSCTVDDTDWRLLRMCDGNSRVGLGCRHPVCALGRVVAWGAFSGVGGVERLPLEVPCLGSPRVHLPA